MIWPSLLAAGALASQATAFLVPLEVAKAVKTVEDSFHLSLINHKASSISLACPSCYFDTANDRQDDYAEQPENTLALNFNINDRDNSLSLNGQKFYPLEFPYPVDLYAPLVRSANGIESPPIHLGFALEYLPFQDAAEGTVVPIRLTIVDLDGVQVKVPSVTINLIKLPTQELLIANVGIVPFKETPGSQCETVFCRVREITLARLREMIQGARAHAHQAGRKMGWKGCPGRKVGATGHRGKLPGHRRPHGLHHHRHHHHGLRKFFHRAMHLFIIPALLGVIGGLTASAIGMFVGQLIVFMWFRFVRGGQRGNASARNEVAVEEEKEALVIEEDEESPPVYEESETIVVVEEKQ